MLGSEYLNKMGKNKNKKVKDNSGEQWIEAQVNFKLDKKPIMFFIYHNMPEIPGLSFNDAMENWLARTSDFTDKSLVSYIMSKNTGYTALTKESYDLILENTLPKKPVKIGRMEHYPNGVVLKRLNKRTAVIKDEERGEGCIIELKMLVKDDEEAKLNCSSEQIVGGKIRVVNLGCSDSGLVSMFVTIGEYLEQEKILEKFDYNIPSDFFEPKI